jgi:DNA-binding transcriptional LysR family regulator
MELRHLRYFMAVGEEQHYGRAARRLRVAQPALSRQIQDLEKEIGFRLFERLPRGVRLSAAGELFLEDVRRILQDVDQAAARAGRVALGRSGTLRVGFTENASWRGVVPESFRRFRELQADAELQLQPSGSLEQMEAIRSGRLDAGFVFDMPRPIRNWNCFPSRCSISNWRRSRDTLSRNCRNCACVTWPRLHLSGFQDGKARRCTIA